MLVPSVVTLEVLSRMLYVMGDMSPSRAAGITYDQPRTFRRHVLSISHTSRVVPHHGACWNQVCHAHASWSHAVLKFAFRKKRADRSPEDEPSLFALAQEQLQYGQLHVLDDETLESATGSAVDIFEQSSDPPVNLDDT